MNTKTNIQPGAKNSSAPLTPADVTGPEREILISQAEQSLISMLEKYDDIEEFALLLRSIREYFKLRDDAFRKASLPVFCRDRMSDDPAEKYVQPFNPWAMNKNVNTIADYSGVPVPAAIVDQLKLLCSMRKWSESYQMDVIKNFSPEVLHDEFMRLESGFHKLSSALSEILSFEMLQSFYYQYNSFDNRRFSNNKTTAWLWNQIN